MRSAEISWHVDSDMLRAKLQRKLLNQNNKSSEWKRLGRLSVEYSLILGKQKVKLSHNLCNFSGVFGITVP